jgi:hypothetical protein
VSQPFDFGDIAVCELCGRTMAADEVHLVTRSTYSQAEQFASIEAQSSQLRVCPRCANRVARGAGFRQKYGEMLDLFKIFGCLAAVGIVVVFFLIIAASKVSR